jgi:hypothetical protein
MGDSIGILLEPPELSSSINTLESPHRAVRVHARPKRVALCRLRFPLASSRGFGRSGEPPAVRPNDVKPEEPMVWSQRGMSIGGSVGRIPSEGLRVTLRASAMKACGFSAPQPVPLFSLNPVPSPYLIGFSRSAPQSVAGGRRGEDSRVRIESPVLVPDAMDSHIHLNRSLRRLRLDPSTGIQEFLTKCPAPSPRQQINLVGGVTNFVGLLRPQDVAGGPRKVKAPRRMGCSGGSTS